MASDINKFVGTGRLVKDPELRHTNNGTPVCSFSVASNHTFVSGGEKKDQVSYFSCVAWANLGEAISKYCKKGSQVAFDGRLQQRSWDDKDGNKRQIVEIVVEDIKFLSSPSGSKGEKKEEEPGYGDNPFSEDE